MKICIATTILFLSFLSTASAQGYIFGGNESGLLLSGGLTRSASENNIPVSLAYTHKGALDVGISYQSSRLELTVENFDRITTERIGLNVVGPYVAIRTPYPNKFLIEGEASLGYAFLGQTDFIQTDGLRIIPWGAGVNVGARTKLSDILSIYPIAGLSVVSTTIRYTTPGDFGRDNARTISESVYTNAFSLAVTFALRAKDMPQVWAVRPFVSFFSGEDSSALYGISLTLGMGTIEERVGDVGGGWRTGT